MKLHSISMRDKKTRGANGLTCECHSSMTALYLVWASSLSACNTHRRANRTKVSEMQNEVQGMGNRTGREQDHTVAGGRMSEAAHTSRLDISSVTAACLSCGRLSNLQGQQEQARITQLQSVDRSSTSTEQQDKHKGRG